MGADLNVRSWPVAIVIMLSSLAGAVRAQDALVLDTYTCGEFLADLGDRGNSARLRRSLMMISWAAGYAAARHSDGTSSLEVIAATLGDVCRNSPAEKAARAITDKINETANRGPPREATAALPSAPLGAAAPAAAPRTPAAPASGSAPPAAAPPPTLGPVANVAPAAPAAGPSARSFTIYTSRDMEGGDYYKERGASLEHCESLCKKDSRCQAYSYDVWNRYCFLKASVNPLRLEPRSITSVAEGERVTYDEREPVIQRRPQKAFPNEPYLQANAQSYGDCAQRCLKDKRCEAFNFYQSTRQCHLIERPREYSDVRGAELGIKLQPAR
jgi:hypothetical protein